MNENSGINFDTLAEYSSSVAQFTVPCRALDGLPEFHRIIVQRDGSVLCPDHYSESESVVEALGGVINNTCSYWRFASNNKLEILGDDVIPNRIQDWVFDGMITSWTAKAVWVAISAMLGKPTYTLLDPEKVLALLQVYYKHNVLYSKVGKFNVNATVIENLLNPPTRWGGFRRSRPVEPSEVDGMLSAGVPVETIPYAVALDFNIQEATVLVSECERLKIPVNYAIYLADLFQPNNVIGLLGKMSEDNAVHIPKKLALLADKGIILSHQDLEKIFLTQW